MIISSSTPPWFSAILEATKSLLIAVGAVLIYFNWDNTTTYKWIVEASAGIMVAGPLFWGVWSAGISVYKAIAVGVQAGITMTANGRALDEGGNPISAFSSAASTPPKQVTVATARDIVKSFGPTPGEITKS